MTSFILQGKSYNHNDWIDLAIEATYYEASVMLNLEKARRAGWEFRIEEKYY